MPKKKKGVKIPKAEEEQTRVVVKLKSINSLTGGPKEYADFKNQ